MPWRGTDHGNLGSELQNSTSSAVESACIGDPQRREDYCFASLLHGTQWQLSIPFARLHPTKVVASEHSRTTLKRLYTTFLRKIEGSRSFLPLSSSPRTHDQRAEWNMTSWPNGRYCWISSQLRLFLETYRLRVLLTMPITVSSRIPIFRSSRDLYINVLSGDYVNSKVVQMCYRAFPS